MTSFSPVNTLLVLRDEYYDAEGDAPNWERLARILHCPNDDALKEHVEELSQKAHGSFWAKTFLNGEHYHRAYTRKKGQPSRATKLREKKLRRIWSMLDQRLTYREMSDVTGYSLTTVHELMRTIERRGIIEREGHGEQRGAYIIRQPYQWIEGDD